MPILRFLFLAVFWLSATLAQASGFTTIEIPADQKGPAPCQLAKSGSAAPPSLAYVIARSTAAGCH